MFLEVSDILQNLHNWSIVIFDSYEKQNRMAWKTQAAIMIMIICWRILILPSMYIYIYIAPEWIRAMAIKWKIFPRLQTAARRCQNIRFILLLRKVALKL